MNPPAYDELIHALAELEDDAFLEGLSKELGETVEHLIKRGFETATAPDGTPWAPRKLAAGRHRPPHLPLDYSGAMKSSFHVESNRTRLKVTNEAVSARGYPYAEVQNYGNRAGTLAARPMVPGDDLGTWEEPLRETALAFFNSKLNGVG